MIMLSSLDQFLLWELFVNKLTVNLAIVLLNILVIDYNSLSRE